MTYVHCANAEDFYKQVENNSVKLICIDPPYFGIVDEHWDNKWNYQSDFVHWLFTTIRHYSDKLTEDGSLLLFGGIGKHGVHPLFHVVEKLETLFTFRNWITWKKRRAYGKTHDYLYCREEIVWFSKSPERTEVTFNIPLLDEKRGYVGYDPRYPAKSEFKRVSNVWTDYEEVIEIPELMRPERTAQKPVPFMRRLIETHSDPGDLVLDFFCGWGSTGVAALECGRRFLGCEAIQEDAVAANARCEAVSKGEIIPRAVRAIKTDGTVKTKKTREIESVCGTKEETK